MISVFISLSFLYPSEVSVHFFLIVLINLHVIAFTVHVEVKGQLWHWFWPTFTLFQGLNHVVRSVDV